MLQEKEIELGAGRYRYRMTGAGRNVLYLGGTSESVNAVAALLGGTRNLVAPSWVGHGGVAEPAVANRVLADLVAAFIEVALGGGACDVIGHGDAAACALWLAIQYPERVDKLILLAPDDIRADDALSSRLADLKTRTLVIFGTRDADAPAVGPFLRAHLPVSHLAYIYDAARAVEVDQPQRLKHLATGFLEHGAAYVVNAGRQTTH